MSSTIISDVRCWPFADLSWWWWENIWIQRRLSTFLPSCLIEWEREMFYLTTHSTHFIYGFMASDIWLRTILIVRKETRCRHIGYSYRLTARVLLYAPSHRQDNTYHGLCYTSRGALAGTRNSSMGPPHEGSIRRPTAPWANALPLSSELEWVKMTPGPEIVFLWSCQVLQSRWCSSQNHYTYYRFWFHTIFILRSERGMQIDFTHKLVVDTYYWWPLNFNESFSAFFPMLHFVNLLRTNEGWH